MKENSKDIPVQQQGNEVNVEEAIVLASKEEAELLFNLAIKKLINVNEWYALTSPSLSRFQLTDSQGREVFREVREGDFIRIEVPAPGTVAGEGYDWVKVEDIDYSFEKVMDSLSIRVRPVPSPLHPEAGVAHFFDGQATSTFKVSKAGLSVIAGIYGRNEIPNLETEKLVDKIRNVAVATGAVLGGSRVQWSRLVNGILGN